MTMASIIHKMVDMAAACGADSWDLAISWENVTCEECMKYKPE